MAVLALLGTQERTLLDIPDSATSRRDLDVRFLDTVADFNRCLTESGAPGALVLDADVHELGALHLVASLRRVPGWEKIPMLVMGTGDRSAEVRMVGGTEYYKKPLDRDKFLESLAGHLAHKVRRSRRRELSGLCLVITAGKRLEARLQDVSMTGVRVSVDQPLPLNSMVQINFGIPGSPRPHVVRCKAKVARHVPGGYGFSFTTMEPSDRAVLYSFTRGE